VNHIRQGFGLGALSRIVSALAVLALSVLSVLANNNDKPAEVPAKVIAHLSLKEPPGSEMLLQNRGDHQYLYVQKASKQGFMVVDVTKPSIPGLVNTSASVDDATAGKLEMAGPDVALAEIPDKSSKGVIRSTENPIETVKILDLSNPAHPKVLQTFTGVTSNLKDSARGLIYLANNDGLWILRYPRAGLEPSKKKRPCGSDDALASMPPDCQ